MDHRRSPKPTRTPRASISCEVCGKLITRPEHGGSKQFVHAGKGSKKSECQKIARYLGTHEIKRGPVIALLLLVRQAT